MHQDRRGLHERCRLLIGEEPGASNLHVVAESCDLSVRGVGSVPIGTDEEKRKARLAELPECADHRDQILPSRNGADADAELLWLDAKAGADRFGCACSRVGATDS